MSTRVANCTKQCLRSTSILLLLGVLCIVQRRQPYDNAGRIRRGRDILFVRPDDEGYGPPSVSPSSPSSSSVLSIIDGVSIAASTVNRPRRVQSSESSSRISGFAFLDSNDDGIYDVSTSTGICNTFVDLFNCTGDIIINTTKTDRSGYYSFDELPGGQYYISSTPPQWFTFSDVWRGKADETGALLYPNVDSAINPETGSTDCFDLEEGEDKTVSFGLKLGVWSGPATSAPRNAPVVPRTISPRIFSIGNGPRRAQSSALSSSSISGFAFFDSKSDGIYDVSTSARMYNTSVSLFNCTGEIINTTKTDSNGYYSFDGLPGGQYYVSSTPQPWYAFSDVWRGKIDQTYVESMYQHVDSAINPRTGRTGCFDLEEGEDNTVHFGLAFSMLDVGSNKGQTVSEPSNPQSNAPFNAPSMSQMPSNNSTTLGGSPSSFFTSSREPSYNSTSNFSSSDMPEPSNPQSNAPFNAPSTSQMPSNNSTTLGGSPSSFFTSSREPSYNSTSNFSSSDMPEPSNPQSNAPFNAPSTSQLPSTNLGGSPSSFFTSSREPSYNSTSNFSSSDMPSASPSSESGGFYDITTRERLIMTIRGIEQLEDEETWSVATSNYILVYFNSISDDPGVFDVTVTIEVMHQWNNNDARLNRPDDRQMQVFGESKTFVEVTFLAVLNYKTANPEEYDSVYVATAPFSSQYDMEVYTSTLLGISPYYEDNVLSVAMGRMGLASPGIPLKESIGKSSDAEVDKQLVMTIYGIEMLEDEEAWSVATSNYIMSYFNLNHRGAYNVTASIEVTDQTSGNDTSFEHPQGWRVQVAYELTSSHRTSNPVKYDDIYVATAPFFSRTASEGYIEALHSLSPYYNDVRFVLVNTPPSMSIVLTPKYLDDNKDGANTNTVIIVGAICGATILVVISVGLVLFVKKSRKEELSESTNGSSTQPAGNDLENTILNNLESQIANDSMPPSILRLNEEAHSKKISPLQVRFGHSSRFSTLSQSGQSDQSSNPSSNVPSANLLGTNSVPDQKDSQQLNSSSQLDRSSSQRSGSIRSNALCDIPEIESDSTITIVITAPAGKLGIVTETPLTGGPAFVCDVLNSSSIIGLIRLDDRIIAVDDKDVRDMSGAALSKLIASKKHQSERKITILRKIDAIKNEGAGSVGEDASSMVSYYSSPIPSANTSAENALPLTWVISSSPKAGGISILSEFAPNGEKEETAEFLTYENSSPVNKTPSISVDNQFEISAPPGWMGTVQDDPKQTATPGTTYASRVLEISPSVGKLLVGDKVIFFDNDDVQEMTARNVTRMSIGYQYN